MIRLALNADTTPLSVSSRLVFKSLEERAREAAAAGFEAVNVDRSEPGLTAEKARQTLDRYGLEAASGFFHGHFYDRDQEACIRHEALLQAEFSSQLGQDCLFVSAFVSHPEREAIAGRVYQDSPCSLTDRQFFLLARQLEWIARLWRDFGIQLLFHPHVATYIEAPHEIDKLMSLTDPALVKLGPDTGHLLFGGYDPLECLERYFNRIGGLHIKDVRREVLEKVRREKQNYQDACGLGVWTEIGRGSLDFPALFQLLRTRDWSGWVIVETDHTEMGTAVESSKTSRQYLANTIGI